MKYKKGYLILLAGILFVRCSSRHKITYNIPEGITPAAKEKLMVAINEGKELYKANCTQCHGVFTKGKDKIPDFTNTQIDNYSTRYIKRDPKNHAAAIKMSPQQLNEILTFLRYKNPQNPDSARAHSVNTRRVRR